MVRPSHSRPEPGRTDAGHLRAVAAEVVAGVCAGASLDAALPAAQQKLVSVADRALLQALSYGVLRDLRLLEYLAAHLLQKALQHETLKTLLLTGLYQLRNTRIPAHAAVSETVAAVTRIGQPAAGGLVNAVLRRYQRERETLETALQETAPAILYSHPDWLSLRLQTDWPGQWPAILAANQSPGPMTLRVNRRRITRETYLQKLRDADISAQPTPHSADGIELTQALPVSALPGFAEGEVSVQDQAAQLATGLLELPENAPRRLRVLDACAAPGGKSAHILERSDVDLLALDHDATRLLKVNETLTRLGLEAICVAGNALDTEWWDECPFDRILLDAPCSGTGVIRRHPDIKWLRRPTDIAVLAARQRQLLTALWSILAPGGVLLYAVCSVLRAESEDVVADFLRLQSDAHASPIEAGWGETCGVGRRIAPGCDGMDGFYYARLRKAATREFLVSQLATTHPQA